MGSTPSGRRDNGMDSAVWVRFSLFSLWILYGGGPRRGGGPHNSIRPMNPSTVTHDHMGPMENFPFKKKRIINVNSLMDKHACVSGRSQ